MRRRSEDTSKLGRKKIAVLGNSTYSDNGHLQVAAGLIAAWSGSHGRQASGSAGGTGDKGR